MAELNAALQSEFARLNIDPARAVHSAPSGDQNSVFDLTAIVDAPVGESLAPTGGVKLVWSERLIGDYDQNGAVEVADVTPIAQNYLRTISYRQPSDVGDKDSYPSGDPDGDGAANWRLARVDGDSNGEIGISDISTIAQHYLERLDGYRVYRKAPGDSAFSMLPNPDDPASPLTMPRESAYSGFDDDTRPVRFSLTDSTASAPGAYYYKVAPFDSESGTEGRASNIVPVVVGAPANYPPEWTENMDEPVTQGRDCRIIVGWPSAIDPNGDTVTYSIYYDDDPIPPTDYTGTLDNWLALACEPVDSTFKPTYDPETDLWSDESVTPPEILTPDDPRILALNPTRRLDDAGAGITHDEIPLQVVSQLPEGTRLNERDWGYVVNQPGGFPPEPGANKTWVRQGPISNVTAIPDYISPTILTYYDGYTTEDSILASEPNMRERGRYYFAVAAVDDKSAHSALIKTSSFAIASAFFAVPLEAQFAPKRIMRNSYFRSNEGNIWTTFELDPPSGETDGYRVLAARYDPDTRTFGCTEVNRADTYSQRNASIVHEFDDGSAIVCLTKSVAQGSISYELLKIQDGTILNREDLNTVTGYPYITKVFFIDGRVVLLYGCTEFSPTHSWPLIMQRGYFGDWDEPELIEENTWGFTVGGMREDRADISIAVHKTELGDSAWEKPQYVRTIRITVGGYEELYKNIDESGNIFSTFENGSILRVSDRQMLMQEDETYTRRYFFTDTPRSPVDDYLESFGIGYQESKHLSIQAIGNIGAKVVADLNPLLRQVDFLNQDSFLLDAKVRDSNANAVFYGVYLDEAQPDIYLSGAYVVFTTF